MTYVASTIFIILSWWISIQSRFITTRGIVNNDKICRWSSFLIVITFVSHFRIMAESHQHHQWTRVCPLQRISVYDPGFPDQLLWPQQLVSSVIISTCFRILFSLITGLSMQSQGVLQCLKERSKMVHVVTIFNHYSLLYSSVSILLFLLYFSENY